MAVAQAIAISDRPSPTGRKTSAQDGAVRSPSRNFWFLLLVISASHSSEFLVRASFGGVNGPLQGIVTRRVLPLVLERMVDDPVVLLEGPRSVGKSTLLLAVAAERGARMIDLDDVATCDAVAADPATFVAGDRTVCIDEYQKAPVVLDAIKAELNRGSRPGRFVLTGSTRHDALPAAAQALTGRLSRLPI